MKRSQAGYVALMAVLVVGAAATAIGTTLLLTGTDSQRTLLVVQRAAQARALATACAEEALQQIHDSSSFTGTNNLNLGQGSCSYTVTNSGGSDRTIVATGTVDTVVRKLQVYATIGSTSISISSWQETS